MFPLWDDVIAPVIDAVGARRIVEIGALRGETTVRMLKRLGPECELHVIDPAPQFDPAEHEQQFPGQYHFHLGTSLDVLPNLPPADVALIDGDHNWYTVYNELRLLAETARQAKVALPVLVLHDVGWPYGRRDLYYEPGRIPSEFRHSYRRAGMRPGRSALVGNGGMNRDMCNAEHEGGPRNGVMTALDDFVAEHASPLRVVVVPVFYGLAIVADDRMLDTHPELAALFDHLESAEGRNEIIALAERIRVDEAIFSQAWIRMLQEEGRRGADRYVTMLKAAVLDELHLDHELRLSYLLSLRGTAADLAALRDPVRTMPVRHRRLLRARLAGQPLDYGLGNLALTTMGRAQLDHLENAVKCVVAAGVPGDFAEVGVGGGGGGILLRGWLEAHEIADRCVWLADPFVATSPVDDTGEPGELPRAVRRWASDLNRVRDAFAWFGLLDDRVRFLQGPPAQTLADAPFDSLALLRLGNGLRASDVAGVLEHLHDHLSPGAEVIVSSTADPEVEAAVMRSRERLGIAAPITRTDRNSMAWRHQPEASSPGELPAARPAGPALISPVGAAGRPPLGGADPSPTPALSVVVAFYNMRREAARTLQSLARSYQRDVEDLEYEVLVVDNGSGPDQRLTPEFVASFGPEFRPLDPGIEPHPSPTGALNAGIAAARGETLALMIDGAHVLTPGVLQLGMKALSTYAPAVVATQQWYVGPGQQGDAGQAGYDQSVEDRLFEAIDWPVDGYRLFEVGHFIGERDWFDGIVESNCLFVPRKLVEQIGAFDERFAMPGGGYANLDLFERLALSPGVTVASILGEGTFHQFHGGTTTNVTDEAERRQRVVSYREHFEGLRGRALIGLDRPVHYVGAMATKAARRTRSRRELQLGFNAVRQLMSDATAPPVRLPDELKLAAIEGVWDDRGWQGATWLGHPVDRYPADLHVYQELLAELRPDLVVVAADDPGLGGRALFLASVCELLGHGRVVAIGNVDAAQRPSHPRLAHVVGAAEAPAVAEQIASLASGLRPALVLLGMGERSRVVAAFERYAPMVPAGGYVIVENTIVKGRSVDPRSGPGPYEAVEAILARHGDFVADPAAERYALTFNRGGYLKRIAGASV